MGAAPTYVGDGCRARGAPPGRRRAVALRASLLPCAAALARLGAMRLLAAILCASSAVAARDRYLLDIGFKVQVSERVERGSLSQAPERRLGALRLGAGASATPALPAPAAARRRRSSAAALRLPAPATPRLTGRLTSITSSAVRAPRAHARTHARARGNAPTS